MAGPESWFRPELIEKHAPGMVIGAVLGIVIAFRVIKSGALVFGDKVKILVEKEQLALRLEHAMKEIEERDAIIAALKNANGGK